MKVINWIIYRTKVKEYIYHENSLLYDTELKQITITKKIRFVYFDFTYKFKSLKLV